MVNRFILSIFIVLVYSCDNSSSTPENADQKLSKADTLSIFKETINYKEFREILDAIPIDTLYIVKNKLLTASSYQNIYKNKHLVVIPKPDGYPKNDLTYKYDRVILSMEFLDIKDSIAKCLLLNKYSGVVGEFKLKKTKNSWKVSDYNKIMI